MEFDLNAFYEIDEIDGFVTVFVEENVDVEIVFNFVVAVTGGYIWVIFCDGQAYFGDLFELFCFIVFVFE